jgi:hypothetical protein
MNFLDSEISPDCIQTNNAPQVQKLNIQILFDKNKLPTKLIKSTSNNNLPKSNSVFNSKEKKINNINNNKNNLKIKNLSSTENIDFNNLSKNLNEERSIQDKPLLVYNGTSSISEILFNKPAPTNFIRSKNLCKSCTRLEMENIKSKLYENSDKDLIEKSKTDFVYANKVIKITEKSFDAYSNCDIKLRNLNRKMKIQDKLDEIETEAYGFTNEINRNFKGEMKFNLDEIDMFLNDENEKREGVKKENEFDNPNFDEVINKEMNLIKKMSADLRRIDTLSTSDIFDKNGPGVFSDVDLQREINKIKSQVFIFFKRFLSYCF